MRTQKKLSATVLIISLLLAWCPYTVKGKKVYQMKDVIQLNRALVYILPPAPLPAPTDRGRGGLPTPNAIKIEPGMKLLFRGTPLRTRAIKTSGEPKPEGTNTQTPVLVDFEWIAPETLVPRATNRFTREDYFFFQYMLAAGIPVDCDDTSPVQDNLCNATTQFEKIKEAIKDDGSPSSFLDRLSQRTLVPAFRSLTLEIRRSPPTGIPRSPLELRELIAEPSLKEFEASQTPNQSLRLQFPGLHRTVEIAVYGWSSAFFNDPVGTEQSLPSSLWYAPNSNPSRARGYIDVMVPVRVTNKPDNAFSTSDFFPVYFSVADVERRLGMRVRGLRRSEMFVADFADAKSQLEKQKLISPNDGYFTLWFDRSSKGYGAKAVMRVAPDKNGKEVVRTVDEKKQDILIAPGDVLILDKKRLSATDRPEAR